MKSATLNKFRPADFPEPKEIIPGQLLFVTPDNKVDAAARTGIFHQPVSQNLNEAKFYLQQTPLSELPELIILDTPLNLKELFFFRSWLSQNLIPPIPIIYIEHWLNPAEIKAIFQADLIDDVIKNNYDAQLLLEKLSFFKSLTAQSLIDPTFSDKSKNIRTPLWRKWGKRGLDIILSFTILIVLTPLLAVIGILIKITSKGPILYKSKRAGEGFKVFNFYKFRTMVPEAEVMMDSLKNKNMYNVAQGDPCFFKISDDPRVTRIGLFLRNTSLDELPQLFNVLKGDMSLVGNRPLPLYEAATLTTREWAERFMAPAGITGLWQVSKRGKPTMTAEDRISLDIAYARKRSLRKDLKILLATPSALIQKQSQ